MRIFTAYMLFICLISSGCYHTVMPVSLLKQPPHTERRPVTETLHGQTITDNYRWLEGYAAPDSLGELTDEVADWTTAQNTHTRNALDNLPGREAITQRIGQLMRVGSTSRPRMRGDLYFNTEREGDQKQGVLYVRQGFNGDKRVLLDVNALDPSGLTALAWYTPNQDGSLLAYGTYQAGDENATLHLLDVATGEKHPDVITGKVGGVSWMPDGKRFVYSKLRDVENPYSRQIRVHTLGQPSEEDLLLFEQHKEGPLATTWGPFFSMSRDGRWLALGYYTSTSSNDLWLVDLEQAILTGNLNRIDLVVGEDANTYPFFAHDRLYLNTQVDAPNGKVYSLNPHEPFREAWSVVLPEADGYVLRDLYEAQGTLIAGYEHKAHDTFIAYTPEGKKLATIPLPGAGLGSAGISTHHDRTEAFIGYTSFNEPTSIYRLNLADAIKPGSTNDTYTLWARPEVPVDPGLIDVKQVTYTSKDGTPVTMFLVHKKGTQLTGDNPTLLYGYGGFNISMTPYFSATMFPFFEAGGVYAVANLRGGGEYGDAWHKAGMLDNKQNVFDDFIAAAQWLIETGYTNPDKLAIAGGSNGGLLVGAVMVQRPELFKAVICGVPLLDMLRYQHFLMARYWVPEYGDPAKPEDFTWLKAYSPYHNVTSETSYPATLVTAGENDTRVHALHARKFAALLQTETAATPTQAPILLWVDQEGGHGQGKPLDLRIRDVVDQRAFLMWQLGMTPGS